jgi:hypothetical protein
LCASQFFITYASIDRGDSSLQFSARIASINVTVCNAGIKPKLLTLKGEFMLWPFESFVLNRILGAEVEKKPKRRLKKVSLTTLSIDFPTNNINR